MKIKSFTKQMLGSGFAAAIFSLLAPVAQALPVDNASFESPDVATSPGGGAGYVVITSSGTVTNNDWIYSPVPASAEGVQTYAFLAGNTGTTQGTGEGLQDAFINANLNESGTITSTDSFTLTGDTNYSLTVAVGNTKASFGDSFSAGTATISLFDTTTNQTLASQTVTPADMLAAAQALNPTTPNIDSFWDFQVNLSAAQIAALGPLGAVGDSFTIQLTESASGYTHDVQGDFDNVRLDASAIPEPSTWAMMFAGLTCLVGLQRFTRRA